jgi:hypothetical protein
MEFGLTGRSSEWACGVARVVMFLLQGYLVAPRRGGSMGDEEAAIK